MCSAQELCQSFNVILEMLQDRGYNVDDVRLSYNEVELSRIYLGPQPSSIVIPGTDGCKSVRILYFTSQQVKTYLKSKDIESDDIHIHIIVLFEPLNHATLKTLTETYKSKKSKCQLFNIKEVLINISKHILVPKHELMSKEEQEQVLKQLNVTRVQLPWILKTDPMARYLGLESLQIIRIISPSPTSGQYISYRTCV